MNVIDTQGTYIAKGVENQSKNLNKHNNFTAATVSGDGMSYYQLNKLITACNKELCSNQFSS